MNGFAYLRAASRAARLLAFVAMAGIPAVAQDEQTDDHADRDRRYLERYLESSEQAERAAEVLDRDAFIEKAEALVRDVNYDSRSGDGVRVQSDDPALDLVAVVSLLEDAAAFLVSSFPRPETDAPGGAANHDGVAPEGDLLRVFVLVSFHDYNQLTGGDFRFSHTRPAGHYVLGSGVLAAHSRADGVPFDETIVHERAHAWFDDVWFGRGHPAPTWLSEGLASYAGHTKRTKSAGFVPGVAGDKGANLFPSAGPTRARSLAARMQRVRRALTGAAKDPAVTVFDALMELRDPVSFYGRDLDLHYAASWALTHWAMHADDGARRDAFLAYLDDEANGRGGPESWAKHLAIDGEALDRAVQAHLKRIRMR